eukprot:4583178-Prymnesium_polylepis.1
MWYWYRVKTKCKLHHRATSVITCRSGEESRAAGSASSRQLLDRSAADVSEASVPLARALEAPLRGARFD